MATNHTFIEYEATPDYTLDIIETNASNIKLLNFNNTSGGVKKLSESSYYGINGGFFIDSSAGQYPYQILNIAMQDGQAVGPSWQGQANSANLGTGALAWNGSQISAYTNIVNASSIGFSGNTGTWVQGGVALWLGYNQWYSKVYDQLKDNPEDIIDRFAPKSAMVANMSRNKIYLIACCLNISITEFRAAIQSFLGINDGLQANNSYQGIMLDGGRSTQLRAKNSSNSTVNRTSILPRNLAQVITLKNAN